MQPIEVRGHRLCHGQSLFVSTKGDPGHEVLVYALLDSGSDTTLLSDETLEKLGSVDSRDKMIDMCTQTDVNGKKEKRKEVH